MTPKILALDISSTHIGWCYLHPELTPLAKSILLGDSKVDIADRCLKARQEVAMLIAACGNIDAVAVEQWVWRFPNTTIPQVLVQGAVLAELRAHELAYCVLKPSEGKKALADDGAADKELMLRCASEHFALDFDPLLEFTCRRGMWAAWRGNVCVYDEHAADALGIGLAAVGRVLVEVLA
jgi:Holliday junction resolvasome RuvABC endonuclease subunit